MGAEGFLESTVVLREQGGALRQELLEAARDGKRDGLHVVHVVPHVLVVGQLLHGEVEAFQDDPRCVGRRGEKLVHPVVVASAVLDDEVRLGDRLRVFHVGLVLVRIHVRVRHDAGHVDRVSADLLDDVAVEVLRGNDVDDSLSGPSASMRPQRRKRRI